MEAAQLVTATNFTVEQNYQEEENIPSDVTPRLQPRVKNCMIKIGQYSCLIA